MNSFCKILALFIIISCMAGIAYAQVDRDELQRNLTPVTFSNFEGPHARIESREQIRQIGVGQGQVIRSGTVRSGAANRYFVIHSVSGPDGNKLDADIFGLGANAGVDHIRNLRLIIQGYLQTAYDYSERDAALLAEYITIYNAVYRGNWAYFSGRYKSAVLQNLNQRQAGISTRYTEWPGNTLMLIPLGPGGLSAVDTSTISDARVVQELQKDEDRGVEQRREMVDLKEREAEAAEQRAAELRATADRQERAATGERAQVTQERRQLEEEKAQGRMDGDGVQEASTGRMDGDGVQEASTGRMDGDGVQEASTGRMDGDGVYNREEAERQEQFAAQKAEEARQERESITRDQQGIIDQGPQAQAIIGVTLGNAGMGRLIRLNPSTKQEVRRSPLDNVYVRTIIFIDGKILAIAGENRGNSAVRLIEIHSSTLELVKQGDDDIHPGSLIWPSGRDLYAITANLSNGTYNLGRFNSNLVLQAKSAVTINPNASVHIQGGNLLTQQADGKALLLDPATLAAK